MLDLLVIALLCLFVAKGKRAIMAYQNREQEWRTVDAEQRQRIVREECAWRVLGRVAGGAALIAGALLIASPPLAVMWIYAAWRVINPVKNELRSACSYRSSGKDDESPYSW
jgi:hypothetical protein